MFMDATVVLSTVCIPIGLDVNQSMCDNIGSGATCPFSTEQEQHFQRRYVEGYNLLN